MDDDDPTSLHKATAARLFAAMTKVDSAAVAAEITRDFVLKVPGTCVLSGERTGQKIAEEGRVICHASGTGKTVDGEPYDQNYLYMPNFRDEKISRLVEHMDTRRVDERLGGQIPGLDRQ
ncbi:MAG: hypothetical protein P8Y48_16655 [Novosphingobium sp.]